MKYFASLLILFSLVYSAFGQEEARLLRFPAIHGNQVVFSYAGDLFTANIDGGTARKLTNHVGYEMFARFSPDGKYLAFTGEYDGNREVYVMPSEGGVPQRLTYTATLGRDDISDRMGPNNMVLTWKNNDEIVFRSRKESFNPFIGQLFTVSRKGGTVQQIAVPRGGWCSFSPDGNQMVYNRIMREFRTWKYYKGGMADDVWLYDFKSQNLKNLTNNIAQDIFPMWKGDKVYFLSDRDRIMNLFVYDLNTKETNKLTHFDTYDIKFPSMGDKQIVFENGGYLYTWNMESGELQQLHIQIKDDLLYARNQRVDASKFIRSVSLAPDAKRLVIGARGDVFTIPASEGITRNLTQTSGNNDNHAIWSPDGRYIAFISDKSGTEEIYLVDPIDRSKTVQLTKGGTTFKYRIKWSPDSKKILWADKKLRLRYIDIDSKKITEVDKAEVWEFNSYNWSPDSKWICYARPELESESKIYLYSLVKAKSYPVTEGWFVSNSPVFSSDGKYLYFTSNRDFNPTYSWTEWNHAYTDMSRVYVLTLSKETPSPLALKNDESGVEDLKKETVENQDVVIDLDQIEQRIQGLPIAAARYFGLNGVDNKVYYVRVKRGSKPEMCLFDFSKKEETLLGNFTNYQISADHKKMLIASKGNYYIIKLPTTKITLPREHADISGMKMMVNKQQEWMQIYTEAWRQMKYFFYDPGMHGVDWDAIYKKYSVLVPYVRHRDDLNYLIGEMIGELSIGHSYIAGGDKPKAERVKLGLLGAKLEKTSDGFYKITEILKGQNWDKQLYSPLTEIGLDVNEGDYIVGVNGQSTANWTNIYEALIGTAGKTIQLQVNTKPSFDGSRSILVTPIADESKLYYYNWVQHNIEVVNKLTDGKVGYIHIPDMGVAGLNEFVKYFYPQLSKKAVIIDDRGNGGGNVSPMIIERLRREMARANVARNTAKSATPKQMIHGPKVCLINEYSASDGDLFPFQFRHYKLGKLIGKRTWGGVTGIRGPIPFVDGGQLYKPEYGTYNEKGWIIEGHGVDPDIVVDNNPGKEFNGEDEQLLKAIEVIMQELKEHPQEIPDVPEFPDKSK